MILSKQVLSTEAAFSAVWHSTDQTRPSLTMQLISGVDVLVHVCGEKVDLIMTIFSHMTRDVSVFVKCDTIFGFFFWKLPQIRTSNFCKVVQQHTFQQ